MAAEGERVAINYVSRLFAFDEAEHVGAITVPTLVVSGRHDITYPPSQVEELAAAIPGAEYRLFQNAGHMPFLNRPAEFNAALRLHFQRAD